MPADDGRLSLLRYRFMLGWTGKLQVAVINGEKPHCMALTTPTVGNPSGRADRFVAFSGWRGRAQIADAVVVYLLRASFGDKRVSIRRRRMLIYFTPQT